MFERLRRFGDSAPKMVPGNHTAELCELFGVRRDSIWLGDEQPEWIEHARQIEEEKRNLPTVSELLQDPDVRVIMEASIGEAAVLELLADN